MKGICQFKAVFLICRKSPLGIRRCWVQVTINSVLLFFPLFSEPIIKPVKTKKFSLMEQTLPVTVYEME